MDKDRVKGTVDDAAGRIKRQVGEWTGDTDAQGEGTAQQIKGKVEKAWGNVKEAARESERRFGQDRDMVVEHENDGSRDTDADDDLDRP